jgi:hypothetical protein
MRLNIGFSFVATIVAGTVSGAQTSGDFAARTALVLTPVGALPPIMTSTIAAETRTDVSVSLRYGHLPNSGGSASFNNAGATVLFPVGQRSTVSLTGGFFSASCRDCDPGLMLGLAGDTRLGETPFGSGRNPSRLTLGLNGELGYGSPRNSSFNDGALVSGMVGLPIGLVPGSRERDAMRIVPFITPGFGFGGIRGGDRVVLVRPNGVVDVRSDELSGTRFMLGGGLGIYNRSSTVSFTLGFQYVSIEDAEPQFGIALTLGGR